LEGSEVLDSLDLEDFKISKNDDIEIEDENKKDETIKNEIEDIVFAEY